jgi:hypothetical protein
VRGPGAIRERMLTLTPCQNNVARITGNALARFPDPRPL